jgi:fumarylacetoacetate (FAA) hydrolase family protein
MKQHSLYRRPFVLFIILGLMTLPLFTFAQDAIEQLLEEDTQQQSTIRALNSLINFQSELGDDIKRLSAELKSAENVSEKQLEAR